MLDRSPCVWLIAGVNAAGKSFFSRTIATAMQRSSYIEIDELRYKVVGGLVAHRLGTSPDRAPEQFVAQAEMAWRGAIALAQVHLSFGFSVVVDGVPELHVVQRHQLAKELPRCEIRGIGLYCSPGVLERRRAGRGWTSTLPPGTVEKLSWYSRNGGGFDAVADSGTSTVDDYLKLVERLF